MESLLSLFLSNSASKDVYLACKRSMLKYLLLLLLYMWRNFFKMLFWGLVFLMFYGLNELVKDL